MNTRRLFEAARRLGLAALVILIPFSFMAPGTPAASPARSLGAPG